MSRKKLPFPWPTVVGKKDYMKMYYLHSQGKLTEWLKQRYIAASQHVKWALIKAPYSAQMKTAVLDVSWVQLTIKSKDKKAVSKVVALVLKHIQ